MKYSDNVEINNRRARPMKHLPAPKGKRAQMRPEPARSRTLKGFLLNEWLPQLQSDVEPTTYRSACHFVQNHIVPDIGNLGLKQLTPEVIRAFYRRLDHKPSPSKTGFLGRQSIRSTHLYLHWALETLVRADRLPRNPASGLKPPLRKSDRFQYRVWTPQELNAFLDFVTEDELHEFWRTMAMTGMRRGEGAGLRWGDFTPRFDRVAVARARVIAGPEVYVTMPKSGFVRTVELDRDTASDLRRLKREYGTPSADQYVFLRHDEPPSPDFFTKRFRKLVTASDLPPIRLHDLRHTHASHLILAGVNIKAVQERLGHADVVITLNLYSHVLPTTQRDALRQLNGFYKTAHAAASHVRKND